MRACLAAISAETVKLTKYGSLTDCYQFEAVAIEGVFFVNSVNRKVYKSSIAARTSLAINKVYI